MKNEDRPSSKKMALGITAKNRHSRSFGFTIVELIITMPIIVLVMGTFFSFMVILYTSNLQSIGKLQAVNDVNESLDAIRAEVALSDHVSSVLSSGIVDAYGPPGGGSWSSTGNWNGSTVPPFSQFILVTPASTTGAQDPNRSFVRVNTKGCGASTLASNAIYYYNSIFFVYQNVLYRRIATNPSPPALCGVPAQQPTCPVYTGATGCVKDQILLTNVSQFEVRYQVPVQGNYPSTYCPTGTVASSAEDSLGLCSTNGGPDAATVLTILDQVTRNIGGKPYTYGYRFSSEPLKGVAQ